MMKKNKPVNMATGGLMNMPPFIRKSEEQKDKGITPYDQSHKHISEPTRQAENT